MLSINVSNLAFKCLGSRNVGINSAFNTFSDTYSKQASDPFSNAKHFGFLLLNNIIIIDFVIGIIEPCFLWLEFNCFIVVVVVVLAISLTILMLALIYQLPGIVLKVFNTNSKPLCLGFTWMRMWCCPCRRGIISMSPPPMADFEVGILPEIKNKIKYKIVITWMWRWGSSSSSQVI